MKIFIDYRDELVVLEATAIAYVEASSNYTIIYFVKGGKRTLTMTLAKFEVLTNESCPGLFVRIGRSLMINENYLAHIDVLKQELLLSDYNGHTFLLHVSRNLLKQYKKTVMKHNE